MRTIAAAITTSLALMWTGAAAAEVNGATIASYCTDMGAFGENFGATATNAEVRSRLGVFNSVYVNLTGFAPFADAEVVFSDDTRRLHTITGIAHFETEAEAQATYTAATGAFDQDTTFITQPTGDPQIAAYSDDDAEFKAELTLTGRTLMLACSNTALARQARSEWTNNFGFGPRPDTAPATGGEWNAAAIAEQQCTPEGAFGQRFGTRVRGRSRAGFTEVNRIMTSPAPISPFQHFEVTITPRSRVVQQVTAKAAFTDARAASAAYQALVTAYEANGRMPHRSEDSLIAGPAGIVFSSADTSSVGYSVFIGLDGLDVIVACSDNALLGRAFDEAFNR